MWAIDCRNRRNSLSGDATSRFMCGSDTPDTLTTRASHAAIEAIRTCTVGTDNRLSDCPCAAGTRGSGTTRPLVADRTCQSTSSRILLSLRDPDNKLSGPPEHSSTHPTPYAFFVMRLIRTWRSAWAVASWRPSGCRSMARAVLGSLSLWNSLSLSVFQKTR